MNIEEVVIPPEKISVEDWQIGFIINHEIHEGGIAIIFCPDFRGANVELKPNNTELFREEFYKLSKSDWNIPIIDLGNIILGKTVSDTRFIVNEISNYCLKKNCIPVFIGGSLDIIHAQIQALNSFHPKFDWAHIGAKINLSNEGNDLNSQNVFYKIFTDKEFLINNFNLIGYQQHLNNPEVLYTLDKVDFNVLRLAEIIKNTDLAEPFFRRSHFASLDYNALEDPNQLFSIQPQINGINNREICALMKDVGLSENLKSVGIFNFSYKNQSSFQLLAQMIWYMIEGVSIRRSHPKDKNIETYLVLIEDEEFSFKREVFTDLWYFGDNEDINLCLPCSKKDFEDAKRGFLNPRLLRE